MVFGEIVEPSSRALWDFDLEDEIYSNESIPLEWAGLKTAPDKIDNLIIVDTRFLTKLMQNSVISDNPKIVSSLETAKLHIYELNQDNYLIICNLPEDINANMVAEKLTDWLKIASKIVCLTTGLISSHHHGDEKEDEFCFIRSLSYKTSNYTLCPRPEIPNLVTGLCSGIFSYCTFIDVPCQLFISYVDSLELDSLNSKPLLKLFDILNVAKLLNIKILQNTLDTSNLYM